jgi:hypothetical protein
MIVTEQQPLAALTKQELWPLSSPNHTQSDSTMGTKHQQLQLEILERRHKAEEGSPKKCLQEQDKMNSRKDIVELSLPYRKLTFMHATMIKKRHYKIKIRKKKTSTFLQGKISQILKPREREREKQSC